MALNEIRRVQHEPAYVLHATPYKETSLVIQLFTRHYGRIAVIAKGAKRPHSALRTVLISLQPLTVNWSGRGEVKTLTTAHWAGGQPLLSGNNLFKGFYLNELLLKLLPREDPHENLFDAYRGVLANLATQATRPEAVLREFEFLLLRELGVGADWSRSQDGSEVQAQQHYVCLPDYGVRPVRPQEDADLPVIEGSTLLAMAQRDFSATRTMQQGKLLIRYWLNHLLAGRRLNTRQMLIDLHQLN